MCLGCAHVSCACTRARARARGGGGGSLEDHNIRWARWHAAGRGLPRRACIAHEMASGGNRGRPIGRCKYIQLSQVRTRTERHCRDKEVKIVKQTGNLDVKSTRWVKSKISFNPCVKSGAANRTIGRRTSSLLTAIFTAILHSPHLSPYKTIRFGFQIWRWGISPLALRRQSRRQECAPLHTGISSMLCSASPRKTSHDLLRIPPFKISKQSLRPLFRSSDEGGN